MKIVCDACSAKYSIADDKVRGKVFKIRCKKCSNIIVVRGGAGEGAAESPPAYDQKETKVFDYSGYDNPQEAAAAAEAGAAADAVWHLVIDQEQIGPMTVDEVHQRFKRGEIDADSYVWREGFGDWERLADVDAFAAFASGGGAGASSAAAAGLFGGAGADDGRTVQSDPADLFSARGGEDDSAGSDLFGGMAASASSRDSDDDGGLFATAGGGAVAAAPARTKRESNPPPANVAAMTGQRNENSVLFSLNNLAALASDSPRSVPTSSSSSMSGGGSSGLASGSSGGMGGGPTEGSGLIDIRSMAQVYLGDSPQKPTSSSSKSVGTADDLPVFSATSFESASPVLLPTAQPAVNNRLLIMLVGLIGVLVIAAVVLVIVVLKGGGDDDKKKDRIAASDGDDDDKGKDDDKPGTSGAPTPAGGTTGTTDAPPVNAGIPAGTTPPAGGQTGSTPAGGTVGKAPSKPSEKKPSSSKPSSSSSSSESKPPPEKKPPPSPIESSGCDEVTCLVEPDKACCRKGGSSKRPTAKSTDSSLPDKPSRADVSAGISKVKGRVAACAKHGGGTVTAKIKIQPDGSVGSVSASGGSSALQGCVSSAVRGAHFTKSQSGLTVNYPFML